ncbi:MAG: CopG family transcriptional regulator [Deltaproteobacteria bacterium]|nr:MAG: CopG family transcriptional regulator [Deltaproteobacteria bacterium]
MATRTKVTVSIDSSLDRLLREQAARTRTSVSRVVEEALRLWQRRRLEQDLERGYRELAGQAPSDAEDFLPAVREALE